MEEKSSREQGKKNVVNVIMYPCNETNTYYTKEHLCGVPAFRKKKKKKIQWKSDKKDDTMDLINGRKEECGPQGLFSIFYSVSKRMSVCYFVGL